MNKYKETGSQNTIERKPIPIERAVKQVLGEMKRQKQNNTSQ